MPSDRHREAARWRHEPDRAAPAVPKHRHPSPEADAGGARACYRRRKPFRRHGHARRRLLRKTEDAFDPPAAAAAALAVALLAVPAGAQQAPSVAAPAPGSAAPATASSGARPQPFATLVFEPAAMMIAACDAEFRRDGHARRASRLPETRFRVRRGRRRRHRLYRIWRLGEDMARRCQCPAQPLFGRYGRRQPHHAGRTDRRVRPVLRSLRRWTGTGR